MLEEFQLAVDKRKEEVEEDKYMASLRTADLKSDGATIVSTSQMGEAIVKELDALTA